MGPAPKSAFAEQRKRGTGNGERGTGTGNGERGTGNGDGDHARHTDQTREPPGPARPARHRRSARPPSPSSTSARTAAPPSTRCRSRRSSTPPPAPAWGSGRSIRTSAASSAAPTAMRGRRISGGWSERRRTVDGTTVDSMRALRSAHEASPSTDPDRPTVHCPQPPPPWLAFEKQILVKTSAAAVLTAHPLPRQARRGVAGDRHRHRSLPAGRTALPPHPADPRGAARLARAVARHHHQVAAHPARPAAAAPAGRAARAVHQHLAGLDRRGAAPPASRPAPPRRTPGSGRSRDSPTAASTRGSWSPRSSPASPTAARRWPRSWRPAGKRGRATWSGSALRLGPAARTRFLPHLAEEFPELAAPLRPPLRQPRQSAGKDYTDALARGSRRCSRNSASPPPRMSGGGRCGLRTRRPGHSRSDGTVDAVIRG